MRERIQKFLAARGVGSRRQVEAWIAAGRITVNGKAAGPGKPVDERDDIRLDGRRLRLQAPAAAPEGLLYHRAGGESDNDDTPERLPKAARWIALSPLGAGGAGLEVFVSDGKLATRLMRGIHALSSEYSVRIRGEFDEDRLPETLAAAAAEAGTEGHLEHVELTGGTAANRWAQVTCRGLRPRDLRRLFARCGLEANRVLRTRLGPLVMDRGLARGRSRRMTDGELRALRDAAKIR